MASVSSLLPGINASSKTQLVSSQTLPFANRAHKDAERTMFLRRKRFRSSLSGRGFSQDSRKGHRSGLSEPRRKSLTGWREKFKKEDDAEAEMVNKHNSSLLVTSRRCPEGRSECTLRFRDPLIDNVVSRFVLTVNERVLLGTNASLE